MKPMVTVVSFELRNKGIFTAVLGLAEGQHLENVTALDVLARIAEAHGVSQDDVRLRGEWRKRLERGT